MKKIGFMILLFALGLVFSVSAHAGPLVKPGTYSSAYGDFNVRFWKEIFFGCSPDAPMSVLKVVGQRFSLSRAVLESREPIEGPDWQWIDTYQCATLILNSGGPWLKRGTLVAKHLTVTKYSKVDENNQLKFWMTCSGVFENSDYAFTLEATFEGTPHNYKAKYDEDNFPEFQMGSHLNIVIQINKKSPRPV